MFHVAVERSQKEQRLRNGSKSCYILTFKARTGMDLVCSCCHYLLTVSFWHLGVCAQWATPQHRGSFKNSREARTASLDRITIFAQPEPNSKAKAPMQWHNTQKSQVFIMAIRWFCHMKGSGEFQQLIILPFFTLSYHYEKSSKTASSLQV